MAAESIIEYKKPGFPKREDTENGSNTRIEYIGDTDTIFAALPGIGEIWGDYLGFVSNVGDEPTENVDITDAFVVITLTQDNEEPEPGTLTSVTTEIDWVTVERPMREHPQFAIGQGGANALTARDIADFDKWKSEENTPELRETYKYFDSQSAGGEFVDLSANAKLFARGYELGFETFEDKAPVARKSGEYVGGPPPTGNAGLKDTPTGFINLPSGYEWRKSADRATRTKGETRWQRDEEWEGAKKVFYDRVEIFWTSP
jgi:hypothetical protein